MKGNEGQRSCGINFFSFLFSFFTAPYKCAGQGCTVPTLTPLTRSEGIPESPFHIQGLLPPKVKPAVIQASCVLG